jgi:hypothetical protein
MIALLLILLSVAVLAAACGGDGSSPVASGGPPDTTDTTTIAGGGMAATSTTMGGPPTTTTTSVPATTVTTTATTSTVAPGTGADPAFDPADFSSSVTNPYFPLVFGSMFFYEGTTEDGAASVQVTVLSNTRTVMGVECVVVLDVVSIDGEVREETTEWYAEDGEGNVRRFGRDTKKYENGAVVSTAGSWEAGVNGAVPGIVMEANPKAGDIYPQGYLKGEAEDMAEILEVGATVEIPFGSYDKVLRIKEWSPLEPGVTVEKFYAPGQGLIKVMQVEGGSRVEVLTDYFCP